MASRYWIVIVIAVGLLWAAVWLARTRTMFGEVAGMALLVFALTAVPLIWLGTRGDADKDGDDGVGPPNGFDR
jgi:hypothetical protein